MHGHFHYLIPIYYQIPSLYLKSTRLLKLLFLKIYFFLKNLILAAMSNLILNFLKSILFFLNWINLY